MIITYMNAIIIIMARYMYVKKGISINKKKPIKVKKTPRVNYKNFRFHPNYGSIFLLAVGIITITIALSPEIKYVINKVVFHKYKSVIVKADPSAAYFEKIINAQHSQGTESYNGTFQISIPTISLSNIPVKANVDGFNTKAYETVLTSSLAQMKGTALPGEVGNVYIYGHSAPQWFADLYPSSFLGIFTNILKLQNGQLIYIKYKGIVYKYSIIQESVISPTDISVLQSPPGKKYLTLMTCIPPGIGTQRYIVKAVQISKS